MKWKPAAVGKLLTQSPDWHFELLTSSFTLTVGQNRISGHPIDIRAVSCATGLFWAACRFELADGRTLSVDGIPNHEARAMVEGFERSLIHWLGQVFSPVFFQSVKHWVDRYSSQVVPDANDWALPEHIDAVLNRAPLRHNQ